MVARARGLLEGFGDLPNVCEHRDCSPWNIVLTDGGARRCSTGSRRSRAGCPGRTSSTSSPTPPSCSTEPWRRGGPASPTRSCSTRRRRTGGWRPRRSTPTPSAVGLGAEDLRRMRLLCWIVHSRSDYRHLEHGRGRHSGPGGPAGGEVPRPDRRGAVGDRSSGLRPAAKGAQAKPGGRQRLAGDHFPENRQDAVSGVHADASEAVGVGPGAIPTLLGCEPRSVARRAAARRRCGHRGRRWGTRTPAEARARGPAGRPGSRRSSSARSSSPSAGRRLCLSPWEPIATPAAASDRTSSQSATGSPSIQWATPPSSAVGTKSCGAGAGVAFQRGDAVSDRVVDRDRESPPRQAGRLARMEGEHLLRGKGAETREAKRPQLPGEPSRRDVDPLLARLLLARETVIDECDVWSSMSAAATRSRWRPRERPSQNERSAAAASQRRPIGASDPAARRTGRGARRSIRVRHGASNQAPSCMPLQQRGVGAVEVDGGASALSAELEQRGEVGDDDGRVPPQRRAARPQPHGDRLGESPSLRQAPGRCLPFRGRDVVDDPLQAPPHPSQRCDRSEPTSQQLGEPRPRRAGDAAQRGGLAHGPSGGGRLAVGSGDDVADGRSPADNPPAMSSRQGGAARQDPSGARGAAGPDGSGTATAPRPCRRGPRRRRGKAPDPSSRCGLRRRPAVACDRQASSRLDRAGCRRPRRHAGRRSIESAGAVAGERQLSTGRPDRADARVRIRRGPRDRVSQRDTG